MLQTKFKSSPFSSLYCRWNSLHHSISQPSFSWSLFSILTQSLSSPTKLNLHHSTNSLFFQSSKLCNSDDIQEEKGEIMVRQLKLSRTFRSIKPHSSPNPNPNPNPKSENEKLSEIEGKSTKSSSWCVYLIASTNPPFKTYVGVTNDFSRRLKQHNGELKGGAKASRAGRPWVCACLVDGFRNQSEACEFESKWKIISRKLPRKKKSEGNEEIEDEGWLLLLQHRHAAMEKLKNSFDCDHLEVDWQLSPF